MWSCLLALCLFLACEAPLGRLGKLLWGSVTTPRQKQDEDKKEGVKVPDVEVGTTHRDAAL